MVGALPEDLGGGVFPRFGGLETPLRFLVESKDSGILMGIVRAPKSQLAIF